MEGIKAWFGDLRGAVASFIDCLGQEPPVRKKRSVVGLGGEVEVQVHDKDGNMVKSFKQPMHTFVKNAGDVIKTAFGTPCDEATMCYVEDITGSSQPMRYSEQDSVGDYCISAGAENDNFGILIGTNDAAWAWAQYALSGKIAHGTSGGQMSYGATTESLVENTGAPAKTVLQRSFDNNSGADITVREIGWFLTAKAAAEVVFYFMIARDVITATTVPNGGRLTVTYNILVNPT